ncbi:alpha/beta hydrolase [Spirillospora sp. CA-294931]|uniref:alpha/beta hydrolase n=1 Tax=Spirillospora sp. CA-294931 TaxID=3240042 RepID=UPI003D8CB5D1
MTVLPQLEPVLERIAEARGRPVPAASVAERRAATHAQMGMRARMAEPAPDADQSDHRVPVDGGEITVRISTPPGAGRPLPVHVFVHGGGWWLGTPELSDGVCARVAVNVGCAVVSVDHRLAPEHPFPVPAEDTYAALCWTAEHADDLGFDAARISIGGVSSGGNLAAAAALMARDRGGPALVAQVLDVMAADLTLGDDPVEELPGGYPLGRDDLAEYLGFYTRPEERTLPYASPGLTPDLGGLPPTRINTAEYDLLRDGAERYGARLRDAGVPVTVTRWAGHIHGSHEMTALIPSSRDWHERNEEFLRERLGTRH